MKYLALLLLLACAGCKRHDAPKTAVHTTKALYIRDSSHHCTEFKDEILNSNISLLGEDGAVHTGHGWRYWNCDGDISVIVYNDEAQP